MSNGQSYMEHETWERIIAERNKLRHERDLLREGHRLIRLIAEGVIEHADNPNLVRNHVGGIIRWVEINTELEADDE